MKTITLCADDFALNDAVTNGILNLIQHKRISAVSCMTTSPHWLEHAQKLSPLRQGISVGIHLDLTQFPPLTAITPEKNPQQMAQLIGKAFLHLLPKNKIESEFRAQLDRFVEAFHQPPQFIDGHQHIHQLPTIRDALLSAYADYFPNRNAFVRIPSNGLLASLKDPKHLVITLTGSLALKRALDNRGIPYNPSFSGSYRFAQAQNYSKLFPTFLDQIGDGGLIMCHPGLASNDPKDGIAASRPHEYEYLMSEKFQADYAAHDCHIA